MSCCSIFRNIVTAAELAKATEIPHRGSLLRFCDSDSAALEAAYRWAAGGAGGRASSWHLERRNLLRLNSRHKSCTSCLYGAQIPSG